MAVQRRSKKRDAILACVRSTGTHPTAEWVYNQLKPEFPDLSLGTVYRNLTAFKAEGLIESCGVYNGLERFERNTKPHAHFYCRLCSAIIDMEGFDVSESLSCPPDYGTVETSSVTFTGICKECAKRAN